MVTNSPISDLGSRRRALWRIVEDAGDQLVATLHAGATSPALCAALLAALVSAVEHAGPAALQRFDPALLSLPATAATLAALLDPVHRRTPEQAGAELASHWQQARPDSAAAQATAPVTATAAALFVAAFAQALADAPGLRPLLAATTPEALQAALAAAADPAMAAADVQTAALARLETLLRQAPGQGPAAASGAAPAVALALTVAGAPPANLGEIGFLSQQPLIHGDELLVGSRDGALHAYDLTTGERRWRTPLPPHYQMPESLALWRDWVLVAPQLLDYLTPAQELLLLDRRHGAIGGRIALPVRQMGAPLVVGDHAYLAGSDGALYAVDLVARRIAWRLELGLSLSPYPPALAGDRLVLPANDPVLRAVDLAERRLAWSFTAAGGSAHFLPSPVAADGAVLAANWNGVLYAVEGATGAERWRFTVPDQPARNRTLSHSPLVAGATVLVGSYDHHLHAVDLRSGALRWSSPDLGRRIYSRPAVIGYGAQAQVFVAPYRRTLYALRLEDGQLAWPQALELAERSRCDLVVADDRLVVGGQQGKIEIVRVVTPAPSVAALLAADDWAAAAEQMAEAGRLLEAAELYAGRHLYYRAALLYRQAGRLAEAAAAFERDALHPPSWRAAALLYALELGRPDAAAAQYERLADWPAAAQAWETAGAFARAATLYAEKLGESRHAVELLQAANEPLRAAALLEKERHFNEAYKILNAADPDRYSAEIQRLLHQALKHGRNEHLEDLILQTPELDERAQIYEEAGEWTKAAETWAKAGEWLKAATLLLAHERIDKALELLRAQPAPAAQALAAATLRQQSRFAEALPIFEQLADVRGQVDCLCALKETEKAAALCQSQGAACEKPPLNVAGRIAAAAWYAEAATLFKQDGRMPNALACRQKVRYLRNQPWLSASFYADKALESGEKNVNLVRVVVVNEGAGAARDVVVELRHERGKVLFNNFKPIKVIARLGQSEGLVELVAEEYGTPVVSVLLHWIDPDGTARTVEMPEWTPAIRSPDERLRGTPAVVHVQGNYYQGEIYNGSVYRDQAYHQGGDRVDVIRSAHSEPPSVGRACPQCGKKNPRVATYCDGCGGSMERAQVA